jgi:hypothetical protein
MPFVGPTPIQGEQGMKLSPVILMAALFGLSSTASAQAQSHPRLTIVNQCEDDAWAILTPGGDPQHPAVLANSSGWFRQYAQQEYFTSVGWLGTIAANSTLMALANPVPGKPPPGFVFVPGQILKIQGAGGAGADLTTTVVSVTSGGTLVTLQDRAQTAVQNTPVSFNKLVGAVLVKGKGAQSLTLAIPDAGAPGANFGFYMGCPSLANNTQPFANQGCVIGAVAGDLSTINTLFEPTFGCIKGTQTCAFNPAGDAAMYPLCPSNPNATNCPPLIPVDFYDISAVDGYTLPMKVEATGTNCSAPVKDASMLDLSSCPAETNKTLYSTDAQQQTLINGGIHLLTSDSQYQKACVAPYKWFEVSTFGNPNNTHTTQPNCPLNSDSCTSVSYYAGAGCDPNNPRLACPAGSGPQQRVGPQQNGMFGVQNTNWVKELYALGYTGYTWQYGDGVGTQTCDAGAHITVTLCPNGGRPYDNSVKWQFSAATGSCAVATGGAYPSLAACQQANMRYLCDNLTTNDPFSVPGALWRADATATRAGQGYKYADWQILTQTKCEDFQLTKPLPGYPTVKDVPLCYQYYGSSPTQLCPASIGIGSGSGIGSGNPFGFGGRKSFGPF